MDPALPVFTVAIASGQSLSPEVDIGGWTLVGILVPANWTTAGIDFQVSFDGGSTFVQMVDKTAAVIAISSIAGGTAVFVALDPAQLRGVRALKVRSATSGSAVNQTNAVTLSLICRYVA